MNETKLIAEALRTIEQRPPGSEDYEARALECVRRLRAALNVALAPPAPIERHSSDCRCWQCLDTENRAT